MAAILHGRARLQAEGRPVVDPPQSADDQRGRREQRPASSPRTNTGRPRTEPPGIWIDGMNGPNSSRDALRQDQADAPGDHEGAELAAVEAPDDRRSSTAPKVPTAKKAMIDRERRTARHG